MSSWMNRNKAQQIVKYFWNIQFNLLVVVPSFEDNSVVDFGIDVGNRVVAAVECISAVKTQSLCNYQNNRIASN